MKLNEKKQQKHSLFLTLPSCLFKKQNLLVTFAGFLMLSSGIGLLVLQKTLIDYLHTSIMIVKPNSLIFDLWKKFPEPINLNIYIFNWTNHEDFLNKSTKPKFKELGPYAVQMFIEKIDVVFNEDNNTVSFKPVFTFQYDTANNRGNLSDQVITINYISLLISQWIIKQRDFIMKNLGKMALLSFDSDVHMSKTVDEHLLRGYQNYILDIARLYPDYHPEIPRFDKMGFLAMRNGSKSLNGIYNVGNGVQGNFDMMSWNYMNVTPYFEVPCSHVKGSVGELFSRDVQNKQPVYLFISDICRYVRFDFEKEEYVEGILGYKYVIGQKSLDNGTLVPENACFCQGNCMPNGVINVSSCRWDLELYVSLPHFYLADPFYLEGIEDTNPRKEKHDAYIIIEPTTSITLKVDVKVQLSVRTRPVEDLPLFSDIPEVFFPLVWVQLKSKIPDFIISYLKIFLILPYIISALGIFLVALGLWYVVPITCRRNPIKTSRKERRKEAKCSMTLCKIPVLNGAEK